MSAKGKGKGIGGKGKRKKGEAPRESLTKRAGLAMPVARVTRDMKKARYAPRVGKTAGIYLAAVLEYCVAEALELAGNAAKDHKKKTISPRHVMLGIRTDDELNRLCQDVIFPATGVMVNINPKLLTKKKKTKKKKTVSEEEES